MLREALLLSRAEIEVTAPERGGFIDVTENLNRAVFESGISEGIVIAFCKHTTATLMLNEWESGIQGDLRERLSHLIPDDVYYRHDDMGCRTENLQPNEPANGPAHVAAMLLGGASQTLPVSDGRVVLGRWQRLFLLELDQPKPRSIHFHVLGV